MIHHEVTKARRDSAVVHRWLSPRRLIVSAFLVLLVLTLAAQRSLRVAYHRWRMDEELKNLNDLEALTVDEFSGGLVVGHIYERFEYHRHRLVQMGQLNFHEFTFSHIIEGTPEKRHLLHRLLKGDCPPNIHWESPSESPPHPLIVRLWCEPEDSPAWHEFVAENDTTSYAALFMTSEPEGDNE